MGVVITYYYGYDRALHYRNMHEIPQGPKLKRALNGTDDAS
jgi:hypothetical protein